MDIRHLKTFKTIVDVGGFMKAADHLGYAQSTVTGHIRAIEQELGQPLFDRLGKNMILTETGKHLLPYANEIIALMDKVVQLPSDEEKMTGEIVIGASESLITTYRLPPILRIYKKRYPKVQIVLKPLTSGDLLEELKQGKTDLAFLMDRVLTEDALHAEPLVTEKMVLVFPVSDHVASKNDLLSAGGTILYTEQGCAYRTLFEKRLRSDGLVPGNTLEFWSIEAIKQCIMSGLGFSFLPFVTVRAEWEENKIICVPTDEDQVITQMVYHKNKWLSPPVLAFMNLVRDQAKGWKKREDTEGIAK